MVNSLQSVYIKADDVDKGFSVVSFLAVAVYILCELWHKDKSSFPFLVFSLAVEILTVRLQYHRRN